MNNRTLIGLGLGAIGALAVALPLVAQQKAASGPVARYDMRAGTVSGMAGMGGGGMMSAMMGGGGGKTQHELYLRLGSSNAASPGAPKADHFMPPSAKLGKSVALVTPKQEKTEDVLPQKPKGRLLIFWGCGEHSPKGQPVVIDFAKVAAGQVPPGLWTTSIRAITARRLPTAAPSGAGRPMTASSSRPTARCPVRTGWRATIRPRSPLP